MNEMAATSTPLRKGSIWRSLVALALVVLMVLSSDYFPESAQFPLLLGCLVLVAYAVAMAIRHRDARTKRRTYFALVMGLGPLALVAVLDDAVVQRIKEVAPLTGAAVIWLTLACATYVGAVLVGMRKVVAVLAVPVCAYVLLVAINLVDDELSPEAQRMLATRPLQIEPKDNGYFAWLGLVAPEAEEPHAWSQRVLSEQITAAKSLQSPLSFLDRPRLKAMPWTDLPCAKKFASCLEMVAADPAGARASIEKGALTLERGDRAMAYPAYQEPSDELAGFDLDLVPLGKPWRVLADTRFALAVSESRHDAALEQLGREMSFHTRQMAGSGFSKFRTLPQMKESYALLSQYVTRAPDAARARIGRLEAMLEPLPEQATSVNDILLYSLVWQGGLLHRKGLDWLIANGVDLPIPVMLAHTLALDRPLFLARASVNDIAELMHHWLLVDGSSDPAAYRDRMATALAMRKPPGVFALLRNPVGRRLFVSSAAQDYRFLFRGRDDLLALRNLVNFQVELLKKGITSEDAIAAALAENAAKLTHPYTGTRPVWNKEVRSLGYPKFDLDGKPDPSRGFEAVAIRL